MNKNMPPPSLAVQFEIEVEKTRYKVTIEFHPLFDSKNKYIKS